MGVRRGMPLSSAHRLVPEASFLEADLDADRTAAEAVFEALGRSTPSLAGSTDPMAPSFGQFELGIEGLEPLWGPEPRLVERVSTAMRDALGGGRADLGPRVGIAGTHFAATVAAVAATPSAPVIVPPGGEAAFLADRPASLLTKDPDIRARLSRFGLRRIGAVAALPRSALIARFGEEGARLSARARGEETEPFRPRHLPERLALAVPVEPAVEELEPLRFVLHRLVAGLAAQVAGRGLAADRAVLALELDLAFAPDGTSPRIEVGQRFPEPTADPEAIERLLFARLEREPPPAAVARLDLELRGTTPAAGQQLPLFVPQAARSARLDWQMARLALTYGDDRIRRVAITDPDAPLPERRWTWRSAGLDGESVA
jgi:protein ImuB